MNYWGFSFCSRNKLKELFESVIYLRNLRSFYVEYNELVRVSEGIGYFDKLEDLVSIDSNNLRSIICLIDIGWVVWVVIIGID